MSWLKVTSIGLYLMASGSDEYVESIPVQPNSAANSNELGTEIPTEWFARNDPPRRLIIDLTAEEPKKLGS